MYFIIQKSTNNYIRAIYLLKRIVNAIQKKIDELLQLYPPLTARDDLHSYWDHTLESFVQKPLNRRIAVVGGTKAEGLVLITAALSDKLALTIASIPNMCHMDQGMLTSTCSLTYPFSGHEVGFYHNRLMMEFVSKHFL